MAMEKQLTFSEKMIESDMEKFKTTGDVKFYRSARSVSENDNTPYIFASIKKKLMESPDRALKINLSDGSYWECLKLIVRNKFPAKTILNTIKHIHERTNANDFSMLSELAEEKLLKYTFFTDNMDETDLEWAKERNIFTRVTLSYFSLQNKSTQQEINDWELLLEQHFESNQEYMRAYHRYWEYIRSFHQDK